MRVDEGLMEAAKACEPVLRRHAADGESRRRIAGPSLEALRQANLLRLYVPKSLGGIETDPVTCTRVVEEVAAHDSAAGWAIMVGNSVAWWCRALPTEGPEEIYGDDPDAFIATAFHPPVAATAVDGGYRLTGSAPLASNVEDAPWLMLTAVVSPEEPSGGDPFVIGAILRTAEAEITDTWHSMGMRATGSNDVSVTDVFVPSSRTFVFNPEFEPGGHYRGALYRAPALAAALAPWTGVALAIARAAVDELCAVAMGKTPFASSTKLRERASAQAKVGRAEGLLRSARALLYETVVDAWDRTLAGEVSSLEQKADVLLASVHAVQSAAAAVELMYIAGGTTGVYTRSPLERHFRDIQVLRQHGFLSESRYETVGQVRLGLPPDLGIVVF